MKIYTKGGDKGESQLMSVGRVPKSHPRLEAYGESDELNSVIGVALALPLADPLPEYLDLIQPQLFVLGSQIAVPHPEKVGMKLAGISDENISALEQMIDTLDASLPQLKNFVLPGGSPGAAQLHVARTVCRRFERRLQALQASESLPPNLIIYVNRLSDLLFTMARYENVKKGTPEVLWKG